DLAERLLGVLERRREDHLHPLVELGDDREQVLPRLRQIRQLLREERVPLFERGELLQCQRIDPAQLRELALVILQAALLDATVEGYRGVLIRFLRARIAWYRLIRAIFRNQNIFIDGKLRGDALEQARQVELLLVDLQLEPVHALSEACQTLPQRALLRAQGRQLLVVRRSLRFGRRQRHPGFGDGAVDGIQHARHLLGDGGRGCPLGAADDGATCSLGRGIALLRSLALQRRDARLRRPD